MSDSPFTVKRESDTRTRVGLPGSRELLILGTAHVSAESVDEVRQIISEEKPDHVCVEIDEGRLKSLNEGTRWKEMDLKKILRKGQGFMLMANLVLASYQRRMGLSSGINPGEEMKTAVDAASAAGIPYTCSDRPVQITLMRAWRMSRFWTRIKLLASLIASAMTRETVSEEDIEALKKTDALQSMMNELADYVPSVKKVLIDERDHYLASNILAAPGKRTLAVVGAGHVPGMVERLEAMAAGSVDRGTEGIDAVPPKTFLAKSLPWIIPLAVAGIFAAGFIWGGTDIGFGMFKIWALANGIPAAIGAAIALAHPLTILISLVAAPITSMNPTIGVGMVAGVLEYVFHPPRVVDMENLIRDISSLRGWYRNRVSRILLVFFLSSLGSTLGTFYAVPRLTTLFGAG